jgi:hypothetical protein
VKHAILQDERLHWCHIRKGCCCSQSRLLSSAAVIVVVSVVPCALLVLCSFILVPLNATTATRRASLLDETC